jgi:nucleotide-binding universal stress UspA family protein
MFERIVVPLDGSELAETVIPYVRDIAGQLDAEVYLLNACPAEHQVYLHMNQTYIKSTADKLRQGIIELWNPGQEPKVQGEVVIGDAEKVILDYVKQKDINLVAMTTHGTSGIRPWSMGNIADKVIREVGVPTLLIRVKDGHGPERKRLIQRILLPLDSSDASRVAVPYAVYLAKRLEAVITLFSMAQTIYAQNLDGMGAGLGVNWDSIDTSTEKYTDTYLRGIEEEMKEAGVTVNRTSYLGLDAAYEILEMEKRTQADLVIMATRGRSPVARWAFGSVAEKVLREGTRPLLLVKELHR